MAMVELQDGQQLDDGLQLLVGLAEIHVPRMWVEKYPSSEHRVRANCGICIQQYTMSVHFCFVYR